jgi:natural product precursor
MKNLKLTALEADGLSKKAMNEIQGGQEKCGCSCYWANRGGSSSHDNGAANFDRGIKQSKRGNSEDFIAIDELMS